MSDEPQAPPSPPSRGGLIATIVGGVVEALQRSPGLLVVAALSVTVVWLIFDTTTEAIKRRDRQFMFVLDRCALKQPRGEP